MKFSSITSAAIALAFSANANAAIIDNDTYTTDTQSGFDWLDLTTTTGLSFNDVFAELGVGGQFEGWNFASSAILTDFIAHSGGTGLIIGGGTPINPNPVRLLDIWGNTVTWGNSVAMLLPRSSMEALIIDIRDEPLGSLQATVEEQHPYILGFSGSHFQVGSALYRVNAVPVPAAVWLFGSGLLGLVGLARRKVTPGSS